MFESILNDGISGSSLLLEKTLRWLDSLLVSGQALPEGALARMTEVHSGMACFQHIHRYFKENALSETSLDELRQRIKLEERIMLESFRSCFPGSISHVAVYSYSGMVKKALSLLNRPLEVEVALCSPEGEGRAMAEALADVPGITPHLWTDGAYFSRVLEVEAVVMGCDAISPGFLVNRSGTRGLIRLAAAADIPVFVAEGPLKTLSDNELIQMPLKRGGNAPGGYDAAGLKWENPMLEVIGTEGIRIACLA